MMLEKENDAIVTQEKEMLFREINRLLSAFLYDNCDINMYNRHNKLMDVSAVYLAREIKLANEDEEIISSPVKPDDLFETLKLRDQIKEILKPTIRNKKIVEGCINLSNIYTVEQLTTYILDSDSNYSRDLAKGQSETPMSLVKLANKILDIHSDDIVVDTTSGVGNFLLHSFQKEKHAHYYGEEINSESANVSMLRSSILGCDLYVYIEDSFYCFMDIKADKIFSNHPFKSNKEIVEDLWYECGEFTGIEKEVSIIEEEWGIASLIMNHLNKGGKAVAIFRGASLFSTVSSQNWLKKYFVENGLIESIIALPPRMLLYTLIDTFMVTFSFNNESINFVDATKFGGTAQRYNTTVLSDEEIDDIYNLIGKSTDKSSVVPISDVVDKDYDLIPFIYTEKVFDSNELNDLSEVCTDIIRGDQAKYAFFDEFIVKNEDDDNSYVSLLEQGDIQQGYIYQEQEDVTYLKSIPENKDKFVTTDCCVILPRVVVGDSTKVAALDSDETKYYIRGHLILINLDKRKINPYYFASLLSSEKGQKLLKTATTGNTIHTLSITSLKNMSIPLPPLYEQNKIGNVFKRKTEIIKDLRIKLTKMDKEISEVYEKEKQLIKV